MEAADTIAAAEDKPAAIADKAATAEVEDKPVEAADKLAAVDRKTAEVVHKLAVAAERAQAGILPEPLLPSSASPSQRTYDPCSISECDRWPTARICRT